MTKHEREAHNYMVAALIRAGISPSDVEPLRRISSTLWRWFAGECGDSNAYGSWAIERDEASALPYLVHHHYRHGQGKDTISRHRIPDREAGARRRLAAIMERYPALRAYVQSDPRGCSLYILRPDDVPEGQSEDSYYTRGIAVC